MGKYAWVLWLAIAALVIYLALPFIKSILGVGNYVSSFFTSKDGSVKLDTEIANATKKQQPTKGNQYWKIIADSIWSELGTFSWFEDNGKVADMMIQVQNDADFLILVKEFGVREEQLAGVGFQGGKNLITLLKSDLSNKWITKINTDYASKGISYRI